ncbi:MAG: 2-polyprenylphenol 6-hydroxylase [Hyphomicrobiales bacterium]
MKNILFAPLYLARLTRAAWVLMRAGLPLLFGADALPGPLRWLARALVRRADKDRKVSQTLAGALETLGPSYVKFGQFLATRADIIGAPAATRLADLQDAMAPFPQADARAVIETTFGKPVDELFAEFGPAIAAASVAQVHKARRDDAINGNELAVKILRPGIEARFARDLESYFFAARAIELVHTPIRRLRPVDVVATLARTVEIEMDLRLEAAAISEMAENTVDDPDFSVPQVDWTRTGKQVLTTQWIDGIALHKLEALEAAGHDRKRLARIVVQSFLTHAMRDGFFHADMHPGNLFADAQGCLVAVDFGIMGRLSPRDRLFLAEILLGFIERDYARVAQVHFDAGYVPPHHTAAEFSQALRAIGEPLLDKTAQDVSMARLLTQLLQVTDQFDMVTQPQLILLQKTMVVAEGVARMLDGTFDMWSTAEPVVRDFLERRLSPEGRIQDAASGALSLGRLMAGLPDILDQAEKATAGLARLAAGGAGPEHDRQPTAYRWPLWIGAGALVVLAVSQIL